MKAFRNKLRFLSYIFSITVLAVSCVPENESMGEAGQTLLKLYPKGFSIVSLKPVDTSQTVLLFEVRRDIPGPTALNKQTTAVLQFDSDTSILNKFNTDNEKDFIPLPLNLFATTPELVDDSMTVIFNPGEFAITIKITVPNALNFDFTKNYALVYFLQNVYGEGKKSLAADSVIIWGNKKSLVIDSIIIVQIQALNKYDGIYAVTANNPMLDVVNPAFTGLYPFKYKLITSGANTCDIIDYASDAPIHPILNAAGNWSYYGGFCPMPIFDASGDGTITAVENYYGSDAGSNKRNCVMDPSGINKWDVTTKTIKLKYIMIQKANTTLTDPWYRTYFDEKWTYIGPR